MEYIKIDKKSMLPLHVQISKGFKEAIRAGILITDDKLPTEEELSAELKISRPVVRQAYRTLYEEHLIYRYKGRGTFIAQPQTEYNLLQSVNSLTQQIQALGLNTYIQTLSVEKVRYNAQSMHALELEANDDVYKIQRIYYGDTKAYFYLEMIVPEKYFPDLESKQLKEQSFDKLAKIHYPVVYAKSTRTFKAVILEDQICHYLALPLGSVGFCMENISWDKQGTIVEFSYTYFGGLSSKINFDFKQQQ